VNAAERAAKLEECKSNPKIIDATPNCINASRAENNVKAAAKWGTDKEGVRPRLRFLWFLEENAAHQVCLGEHSVPDEGQS